MIPISCSEKNIIMIPATILKISELLKKNCPINDAVEPKDINTKEKPNVKKIVLTITKFFFLSTVFFNEPPEI